MIPSKTTVAIIGGGPVGLVCSILLSLQGIKHVVFERQPDTSIHPKAVGLNQRTLEVFRKIGVEDEVRRQAAPPSMSGRTAWYTSFGPHGREICSRYAWGGGPYQEAFERASPCGYALLPQIRLEPILKWRALELNPTGIFYNHEVDTLEEKEDGVLVHYRERRNDDDAPLHTVSSTYALGCDGGRALVAQLGIPMNGESDIVDMVTAHIQSPISKYRPDPSIFLHWFISPELGGSLKTGYLYHIGPYPMDPETEEWVFACARLPHEREKPFTKEDMLHRMQQTLKIPNLDVDVLSLSHWYVNAIVAKQYRSQSGRIFLVGDAAHRIPPWGALGLNSGIQDADNLIWKLALTFNNPNSNYEELLDSYDAERRPIGERVAQTSLYNMRAHALILDEAIGLSPAKSETENIEAMEKFFDPKDKTEGLAKRKEVDKALNHLDVEFYAHGAEVGWFYKFDYIGTYGATSKAENPQLKPDGEMELCTYQPSLRPGSQLPHVRVMDGRSNKEVSIREVVSQDGLTLFAMASGWQKMQHPMVHTRTLDDRFNDLLDVHGDLKRLYGQELSSNGALLVRPDNIIAYRFPDNGLLKSSDSQAEFRDIVQTILKFEPCDLSTEKNIRMQTSVNLLRGAIYVNGSYILLCIIAKTLDEMTEYSFKAVAALGSEKMAATTSANGMSSSGTAKPNNEYEVLKSNHTGITVESVDKSLAFYHGLLRLPILYQHTSSGAMIKSILGVPEEPTVKIAMLELPNGHRIELEEYTAPTLDTRGTTKPKVWDDGAIHTALEVRGIEALMRKVQEEKLGTLDGDIVTLGGGRYVGWKLCFLTGPDGEIIELMEAPPLNE